MKNTSCVCPSLKILFFSLLSGRWPLLTSSTTLWSSEATRWFSEAFGGNFGLFGDLLAFFLIFCYTDVFFSLCKVCKKDHQPLAFVTFVSSVILVPPGNLMSLPNCLQIQPSWHPEEKPERKASPVPGAFIKLKALWLDSPGRPQQRGFFSPPGNRLAALPRAQPYLRTERPMPSFVGRWDG